MFNLLDTPGHADFSEDTYRTLSAVDAAVMVIDAAKGIENQTRKLFEVCRLRDIPIVTFINKVDREGQDPLALLDEIASGLALDVVPMTWPVGLGGEFQGCLDALGKRMLLPGAERNSAFERAVQLNALEDILAMPGVDGDIAARALEGLELARTALPEFDLDVVPGGTPVAGVLRQRAAQLLRAGAAAMAWPPGRRGRGRARRRSARCSPTRRP